MFFNYESQSDSPIVAGWIASEFLAGDKQFELLRVLFDGHPDMVVLTDAEGHIVGANAGAMRGFGYRRVQLESQPVEMLLPASVRARHAGHMRSFMEHPSARTMGTGLDLKARNADGREFRVDVMLHPLNCAGRQYVMAVCRPLDTDQAYSQTLMHALVQSVTDYAIYMLDPEGRIVTWNEGAERLKGYKAHEALGQEYSIFFLPEDAEAGTPKQELDVAAREGRYENEAWRLRKDGTKFWALLTLTAIRGESGELRGFAKVTRDMTRQKRAEEALLKLNKELEHYRIIVESVGDYAIYTLDTEGRIDSWSPGAAKLLGFTSEEIIGRDYSFCFPPEGIESGEPRREIEEATRTGRCATDSWRRHPNGENHWVSGVLTAIRDESGKLTGYIRVARNMTEQKILEDSLSGMAAELEQRVADRTRELQASLGELQRKNQEVEAFVYTVSHDLRAPLVNVQGFVRELQESCRSLKSAIQKCPCWEQCWPDVEPILEDEIGGALHYISASTAKFERLITALLNLSRQGRQEYQMTRVNVWELVTNAVSTFQQLITEAGAVVEVGQLPAAIADTTALGQVFSNLLGNSLKYRSPDRPLKIEVGGQVEDDQVHYWVRDNGLGIPENGQARLFQIFQRFHSELAQGEGMGLAIAHRIVERHGGKIWAESREGEGAAFHFSLPCKPDSTKTATQGDKRDGTDA